ncbi:hypothetical protein [Peredibacter starrii]|uniref:Topoisomerase II n=1 Tax=Peredibacter starrii TaxID=28202 RepID=A0AAX4HTD8_9BACT|nr:hypothetical protein [Peredibacter starrii]WPU66655.1 hypothetical protein SOO65_07845 [Peredibacter starrii]
MAKKRDPDKSARNRIIKDLKERLKALQPDVLRTTGIRSELSLNAIIGSKNDEYLDLKNDVINSDAEFINKWLSGLKKMSQLGDDAAIRLVSLLRANNFFKNYLMLYLKRSFLIHFDELSKKRPSLDKSEIWIGQENANYGLFVTPRFKDGKWENDKSEIRAFSYGYWTIGHVLSTGLVIPNKNKKIEFKDLDQLLIFFTETLVRNSGSQYEYDIADQYAEFVKNSDNPLNIPFMIPEFRYLGIEKKHKYRLDFMITNPYTLERVGIELSPWSTHGYLSKIGDLTQKEINEMALDNFEYEMTKHKNFFKRHGIFSLIYTDSDLKDCKKLFKEDIQPLLEVEQPVTQISFSIMEEFL